MEHPASVLGMIIAIAGMLIECVAVAAMAAYPIRRALPVKSPTVLFSTGCITFFVGVLVSVGGKLLP